MTTLEVIACVAAVLQLAVEVGRWGWDVWRSRQDTKKRPHK